MKKFNILMILAVLLAVTGCVKPTQNVQPVYDEPAAIQPAIYEEAQPIVYENAGVPVNSTPIYEPMPVDNTVVTINDMGGQVMGQPVNQPITNYPVTNYPNTYATGSSTEVPYPDPYANNGQVITEYPVNNYPSVSTPVSTPVATSTPARQGGGIHLQIAALKDYYTAEDYKNRLSLAPGQSAYVKRGAMNKVIVTGIASVAEANRLKESRFPGAFIVKNTASTTGYTPAVQPSYNPSYNTTAPVYTDGAYTVNNPYGTSSSSSAVGNSGIGVQLGAFSTRAKAQSVANNQTGQYPATVKKIGKLYKVILTGFSSRSAAKSHASRVGGFVVSTY